MQTFIKKNLFKCGFFIFVLSFINSSYADICVNRGLIEKIDVGQVEGDYGGPDGGNAVYVHIKDRSGKIPLNSSRNLNDPMGPSLLGMLSTAMTMRLPVTLIDHSSPMCSDFDEIWVHRD